MIFSQAGKQDKHYRPRDGFRLRQNIYVKIYSFFPNTILLLRIKADDF